MNVRALLGTGALLLLGLTPNLAPAQRFHSSPRIYSGRTYGYVHRPAYVGRTSYGYGPFYPSYIPAPSVNYFGAGIPLNSGGATFYFGTGGGYYSSPYRGYYGHRRHGHYSYRHRR